MISVGNRKNTRQKYIKAQKCTLVFILLNVMFMLLSPDVLAETNRNVFGFTSTRLIYNEKGNKGASLTFINNTNKSFIIMPTIYDMDKNGNRSDIRNSAFVVAPLVKKISPFSEDVIKIIRTGSEISDKVESLFYLSSVLIPSQQKSNSEKISVNIGYLWNMKIFYRPLSLKNKKVSDSFEKLNVSKDGKRIKFVNNSPLWMTVVNIKVNGNPLKGAIATLMVGPYSSTLLDVSESFVSSVELQVVDEGGHHIPVKGKIFTFDE